LKDADNGTVSNPSGKFLNFNDWCSFDVKNSFSFYPITEATQTTFFGQIPLFYVHPSIGNMTFKTLEQPFEFDFGSDTCLIKYDYSFGMLTTLEDTTTTTAYPVISYRWIDSV